MSIIDMILSSVDKEKGVLGNKLLESILSLNDDTTEEINDELCEKISILKEHEDTKNLIWMPYESWNCISRRFKEYIVEFFDPLFFDGVFFEYNLFKENENILIPLLDSNGYLALLKEIKENYELKWVGINSSEYAKMKIMQFNKYSLDFSSRLIKIWGIKEDKSIICKTKKEIKNNG